MQAIEILPDVIMNRSTVERLVSLLIDALNRYDGDPDFEDHPVHGQHDGREPDDSEYEWDARNGERPPVDQLTGADIVQDECRAYPALGRGRT